MADSPPSRYRTGPRSSFDDDAMARQDAARQSPSDFARWRETGQSAAGVLPKLSLSAAGLFRRCRRLRATMSSLDKIQIQGYRSFGPTPADAQMIAFLRPVTLVAVEGAAVPQPLAGGRRLRRLRRLHTPMPPPGHIC